MSFVGIKQEHGYNELQILWRGVTVTSQNHGKKRVAFRRWRRALRWQPEDGPPCQLSAHDASRNPNPVGHPSPLRPPWAGGESLPLPARNSAEGCHRRTDWL